MSSEETIGFIGGKFMPLHLGHIFAITQASNMVDKLYVVLSSSKKRDKEICDKSNFRYVSAEKRLFWLGESLNDLDNIEIVHVEDDQGEEDYDWEAGAEMIKKSIGKPIDFVFSSENGYDDIFKKCYPDAKHVVIDDSRSNVNISATKLRKNLYEHWNYLPASVKKDFVLKIAVVGTESCGKSTLAKKLAKFYNTNHVEEVGRLYCERYSNNLTLDMFDDIAMEHYLLQKQKSESSNKLLFIDSEAVITQYYLNMYFNGAKSELIEEIIKKQDYDLVLYLEPDVEWVADGLRFAGEEEQRTLNNKKLKEMYEKRGIEFVCISGSYEERFDLAKKMIDDLLSKK